MSQPYVVAVETSVVDLHYDPDGGHQDYKHLFINDLPDLVPGGKITEAPRKGDMIMVTREDLDAACLKFAKKHPDLGLTDADNVRYILFGPATSHAGGSLANSFDAMIYSTVKGKPLYNGTFITAVGEDPAGKVFTDSFAGHITPVTGGLQMTSHILPIDGDRIMMTSPSALDSANNYITTDVLTDDHIEAADIIMLGGYLHYSGQFVPMANKVAKELRKSKTNKQIVVTAASQSIAASFDFQRAVWDLARAAPLTLHANTGEFRRFMQMDTEWRERFAPAFIDRTTGLPLQGRDADIAKNQHADYQNAKQEANRLAFEAADEATQENLTLAFVVTNGSKPSTLINTDGIHLLPNQRLDKNLIRSTVGAGDAHVGGYWVAAGMGGESGFKRLEMANHFARAVIQLPEARLPRDRQIDMYGGPLAAASYYNIMS